MSAPAALAPLRQAYSEARQAPAPVSAGGPMIGAIGAIPSELIEAAGARAMRLPTPRYRATPAADRYMDDNIGRAAHAFFEAACEGLYQAFDLLVLSRSHDKLFYYLKEVQRRGEGALFPPLHMFDFMDSRRSAVERFNRFQFEQLTKRLERAAGRTIGEREIDAAMRSGGDAGALRRQLLAHRRERRISGVDALQAIGAGMSMTSTAYAAALTPVVKALARSPALERPALLVCSAEPLDDLDLHAALENAGAVVVAEDDDWGSRSAEEIEHPRGPPLESLFQRTWRAAAGPGVFPREARCGWAQSTGLDAGVDGVVFYIPPSDHQFGWDYPDMRAAFDRAGKPCLLISHDLHDEPQAVAAAAEAFVSRLAGSRR